MLASMRPRPPKGLSCWPWQGWSQKHGLWKMEEHIAKWMKSIAPPCQEISLRHYVSHMQEEAIVYRFWTSPKGESQNVSTMTCGPNQDSKHCLERLRQRIRHHKLRSGRSAPAWAHAPWKFPGVVLLGKCIASTWQGPLCKLARLRQCANALANNRPNWGTCVQLFAV